MSSRGLANLLIGAVVAAAAMAGLLWVAAQSTALQFSPRAARELVDSLMGAVDAAEGHWEPGPAQTALDASGTSRGV